MEQQTNPSDNRRHTIDFSAWSALGSAFDQLATGTSNSTDWHAKELESLPPTATDAHPDRSSRIQKEGATLGRVHPNAFSPLQGPGRDDGRAGDGFGRRASMSQLSFYSGVWDEVRPQWQCTVVCFCAVLWKRCISFYPSSSAQSVWAWRSGERASLLCRPFPSFLYHTTLAVPVHRARQRTMRWWYISRPSLAVLTMFFLCVLVLDAGC